jgi:putative hemolysin
MKTVDTAYPCFPGHLPTGTLGEGHYDVRFAHDAADLDAIQRLRFEVFNLELGEGFDESFATGRDADEFDPLCHHLMVSDTDSGALVGCYRMQTATMARGNRGFYSASLFDLSSLPTEATERSIEVGRACVARTHRSSLVLFLLWKGLALYVAHNQARYLFGCCSLTSQDPAVGSAVLRYLEEGGRMHPEWTIQPAAGSVCPLDPSVGAATGVPPLFGTYLRYGAKVCGPPAIDREFKTIDYLVVLDVDALSPRTHKMFFG